MRLMDTAKDDTNAIIDFLGRQNSVGLGNFAFSMDPFRFNWVHPWTLDRQITRQYPHTLGALFVFLVMLVDPIPHNLANVPGCVIPCQTQHIDIHFIDLWQAQSKYCVEIALSEIAS